MFDGACDRILCRWRSAGQMAILPAELVALLGLAGWIFLSGYAGLTWYWPDAASFVFAYGHYLGPLVPLFVLYAVSILSGKAILHRAAATDFLFLARMAIVFSVVILLHFNLKLWAPLLNQNNFDAFYWSLDQAQPWLFEAVNALHGWMPETLPFMNHPYHDLFVLMFVTSFAMHGVKGRESVEPVLTATIVVLVLGAFGYAIAPAVGPFVFNPSEPPGLAYQQGLMHWFHTVFVQTNGAYYESALFTAMPGAMPSLHLANAVVFYLFALRDYRWLAWLYAFFVLYFAIEAVGLRWHYLVDIPAGVLLGWMAYRIALAGQARMIQGQARPVVRSSVLRGES